MFITSLWGLYWTAVFTLIFYIQLNYFFMWILRPFYATVFWGIRTKWAKCTSKAHVSDFFSKVLRTMHLFPPTLKMCCTWCWWQEIPVQNTVVCDCNTTRGRILSHMNIFNTHSLFFWNTGKHDFTFITLSCFKTHILKQKYLFFWSQFRWGKVCKTSVTTNWLKPLLLCSPLHLYFHL